jgi:multidrug efflux system outer membrane protein
MRTVKRALAWTTMGLLISSASSVLAQTQGPRPGVPVFAPTAPLPAPPIDLASMPEPPPPHVEDPMLTPVPPAGRIVGSWQEALAMLVPRSLDLRNAYDAIKVAEAMSRIALAATLPTVTGTGLATHQFITNTLPPTMGTESQSMSTVCQSSASGSTCQSAVGSTVPTPNYLNGALTMTQPLLAIEAWHAIGTAHVSEEAARLSAEDLKRTLAISVGTDIINVVAAERVAELNRVALRNALEQLALTQLKAKNGAANALDIANIQLALGSPEQIGVPPGFSLNDLVTGAGTSCHIVDRLEARRDIAALRKLEEVAARNVTDVYEQFLPTIGAASTVATTSLNTGTAPNTTWSLQGILTIPLWDGGVRYGNLHQMQALLDEAKNAKELAERTATIAILQAKRGVEVAQDAERVAEQARTTDANIDRMTRAMFRTGGASASEPAVTSLSVQLATETLREAEITLALKQAATLQAKLTLALTLSVCHW